MRLACSLCLLFAISCAEEARRAPPRERPTEPVAQPAQHPPPPQSPLAEIPPIVPTELLPPVERLAFLPRALAYVEGTLLRRSHFFADFASGDEENLVITVWTASSVTWVCLEIVGRRGSCWTTPGEATTVPMPSAHVNEAGALSTHVQLIDRQGYTVVDIVAGVPTAVRHPRGGAESPMAAPAAREPPPLIAALRGLDVIVAREGVLGRADTMIMYCRRLEPSGYECGAPETLAVLEHERAQIDDLDTYPFDTLWEIDVVWGDRNGALSDRRTVANLVRVDGVSLTPMASIPLYVTRETRLAEGVDDFDTVEVEGGLFEPSFDEDCFRIGASTVVHRLVRADGSEQTLPVELRLGRAPDRVPLAGVDGFTTDMQGSWAVLPGGGLMRTPCEID